jgi:hypothetical protein
MKRDRPLVSVSSCDYSPAWVEEKSLVAVLIRKRTGVKNRWVAGRLALGHEGNVTRAIRRVSAYPVRKNRLAKLEAMLVSRDFGETRIERGNERDDPRPTGLPRTRVS